MFPKDTYLVSYSASKDRSMFFTDDDGYVYAIDTAGIAFTDAAAGWKKVTGNADGAWENNPDYTACLTVDGLQKRALGGACDTRPPAAKPPRY
ncbi:hypothetical protein PpBr36_07870 [Pyricularia pennisetigena]|uniref:hypothetical protein n=1 Tax=Pyricularia pennisetigena TaxID=1578925 RepID=UPI001154001E